MPLLNCILEERGHIYIEQDITYTSYMTSIAERLESKYYKTYYQINSRVPNNGNKIALFSRHDRLVVLTTHSKCMY